MALSKDRTDKLYTSYEHAEPHAVKANAVIHIGAVIQEDDTGFVTPVGDPGLPSNPRATYLALEKVDATGLADGDCYVMAIEVGKLEFPSGGVLVAANRGRDIYATADDTFTLTPNNAKVGILTKVEGSRSRVIQRGA